MTDPFGRTPEGFFLRMQQKIDDLESRLVRVLPRWLTASRVQIDVDNRLQAPYMQFGTDPETGFENYWVKISNVVSPTGGRVYELSGRDHLSTYKTTARPGDTFEVSVVAKRVAGSAAFNPYVGQFTTGGGNPPVNPFYDVQIVQPTTATQDLGDGWWRYRARLRLNADSKITRVGAWFQIDQSVGGPTRWLISDPEIRRVDDDTGWQSVTPALGSGYVQWRRIGKHVTVRLSLAGVNIANGSAIVTLGTIPASASPTVALPGSAMGNRNGLGYFPIAGWVGGSAGSVVIVNNSGGAIIEVFANYSYFID